MQPEDYATLAALAPDGVVRGLRVKQQKTGAWVEVPVTGLVRWAIESNIETARQLSSTMIVLDDTRHVPGEPAATFKGRPGKPAFQRDFADVREWAIVQAEYDQDTDLAEEIATLQYRDLRRTCVVYWASWASTPT
jgi:hypothetical protein